MSIPVTCPECGATNKVNHSLAGRRVRCPQCDTAVHVPEQDISQPPPPLPTRDDEAIKTAAVVPAPTRSIPSPDVADRDIADPAVLATPPPLAAAGTAAAGTAAAGTSAAGAEVSRTIASDLDDEDDDEPALHRSPRQEEELDMTPMVDVTFLLLIFFMVTAAFSLQKSIEMPRQQTDAPSTTVVEEEEEELEMVEVQVDEAGTFLVLAADWEEETPGKQNLIAALKRAKVDGVQARLVIKVHEQCKLQFLVDAMDAGTIAGYTETQVTQVDEFD